MYFKGTLNEVINTIIADIQCGKYPKLKVFYYHERGIHISWKDGKFV